MVARATGNMVSRAILLIFGIYMADAVAPTIVLNDGFTIPMIALGTGRSTAPSNASIDEVRNAVYWAIEAGYRHIDTASLYKDEPQVGQAIADAVAKGLVTRDDMFVTTKLWMNSLARSKVIPSLQESLRNLGLKHVNLYLIHFPAGIKDDGTPDDVDYLETWQGMEEAKKLGLTKSIGVANFNITQLNRLIANSKVKPVINQVEVNPTFSNEVLVSHCQSQGIAIMAYSPFGYVTKRDHEDNPPPPREDDPSLVAVGKKYGKTSRQVVLRYLVQRGIIPIPKTVNKERVSQNIALFDFKLTEDEMAMMKRFNKNLRLENFNAHKWSHFPNYPFERV